jgi:hypothetical protein
MLPLLCAAAPVQSPINAPFDFSKATIGLDVTVKGRPLHMILDTGVDPSIIDLATADELGLKVDHGDSGEASGFGDGKGAAVFPTQIEGLAIEGDSFAKFDALAIDMGSLSAGLGRKLDGVLGYSFLADKTVLIDYPASKLSILSRASDAASLTKGCAKRWTTPLKTVDSFPIIPDFRFGNAKAPVSLDTGSTGSIGLFQSALDLPGARDALTEAGAITRTGARGEARSKTYSFNAPVGFGPFTLPAGQVVSTYSEPGSTDTRVANVGNRLLAAMQVKLLLDYRGKAVTFYGDCR